MAHAVALVKGTQSGVLWLTGKGGIRQELRRGPAGDDPSLLGDTKKVCRIAWRFSAGDQNCCRRDAFFRHAVIRLEEWLHDRKDVDPPRDVGELYTRLKALARRGRRSLTPSSSIPRGGRTGSCSCSTASTRSPGATPISSPCRSCCRGPTSSALFGRPEGDLSERFALDRCIHVFPPSEFNPDGGLPPMSDAGIRGMLLTAPVRLSTTCCGSIASPRRALGKPEDVANAAVAAVVAKAAGLPLYVRFVVEDILADEYRIDALDQLPPSLNAYYDAMLKRLGIGELQAILTPLVATIASARARWTRRRCTC